MSNSFKNDSVFAKAVYIAHRLGVLDATPAVRIGDKIELTKPDSIDETGVSEMDAALNILVNAPLEVLGSLFATSDYHLQMAVMMGLPDGIFSDIIKSGDVAPDALAPKIGETFEVTAIRELPSEEAQSAAIEAGDEDVINEMRKNSVREMTIKRESDGAVFNICSGFYAINGNVINGKSLAEINEERGLS